MTFKVGGGLRQLSVKHAKNFDPTVSRFLNMQFIILLSVLLHIFGYPTIIRVKTTQILTIPYIILKLYRLFLKKWGGAPPGTPLVF